MKIAFVNQPWGMVLPPVEFGSISIWTWEVAKRLALHHQVLVYEGCKTLPVPRVEPCEQVQYKVFWVGLDNRILSVRELLGLDRSAVCPPASKAWYYLSYALQVALDIRREGCDIVHIHQCSQFASIIRKFNPKTRIVLHMNCEWLTQFAPELIVARLQDPDLIVGCSEHISGLIRDRFPEIAARCRTIPNGVHVGRFTPPAANGSSGGKDPALKRLAFVGRVSPEKGVHVLLDAFSHVVARWPNVELGIVGPEWSLPIDFLVGLSSDPLVAELTAFYRDGTYDVHLRKRINKAWEHKVKFTGRIQNDELAARYHAADILINPSLSESFGMTVVEAMACGKPVIVSRVGGMKETVQHGKNGLIVRPGDSRELGEAILYLLHNDELRAAMGRAGRKRAAELYSWETVAANWLETVGKTSGRAHSTSAN
jgi:glycosyltransferase involved in cell wall biosynthesis